MKFASVTRKTPLSGSKTIMVQFIVSDILYPVVHLDVIFSTQYGNEL